MSNIIYIEYTFRLNPVHPVSDILIAELGEAGFESFVEEEEGVLAYIQKECWSPDILNPIQILSNDAFHIEYRFKEIEQQNWNATWESNFEPIQIGNQCVVRAPFHERPNVRFDIVIMPKMSFGTGHHETTHMMLQHILDNDFDNKSVLDMGSGTGVLAILAAMKGAKAIDAIDIDHWCYLNAKENVLRNNASQIKVYEGDADLIEAKKYDIILANINRNILVRDIPIYANAMNKDGMLFLSGFYESDIAIISTNCEKVGLKLQKKLKKSDWVSIKYVFS
ncbi:50S ribosomal protein L11 methyltransferase [Flavobacteriaceae bacterium TP-CH-4]|uniref:Ribosomal protein L11 methyltransferase n=1 Tax=Pelagihabitans pacificus TaxID=2696054 RepID=A0A967EC64_9FLAO|nr:50S ribosomal protein L11 methyltransferase [Pelagihabitans pacificus]NHF57948.1 50S ribosomal protein L11 methyltransferase [Pelagihabitans pacificus]